MRKFLFTTLIIISALILLCTSAFGDAALFRGSNNIGAVPAIDTGSGFCVPIEDAGKLLGFSSSRSGEELLLTRGNISIRVVNNSAAAWRGISLVPLYSVPFERDGKYWVDALSAASLFQSSVGSGQDNKLRFSKISSGYPASYVLAGTRTEALNFGRDPVEPVRQNQSTTPTPAINIPQVTTAPVQTLSIPEPTTTVAARRSSGNSQPRYETFKPGTTQKIHSENFSGTIQSIRWSTQEGTHKKIRAVIVADDNAEPQVYMQNNSVHALFVAVVEDLDGLPSPYSNVKAELTRKTGGVDLVLTSSGFTRVEKLILNSPRRIVFDFFFPESVKISNAAPSSPPVTVKTNTPTQITPAKPPAVKTPPSTITIPTTPVTPNRSRRKTIVVDPGHGGKDPGASANGVTEKNVNLAIGLELEKVLKSRGFNVIMTRRTDVYLKLQERTDIANNANADLFVSVHVNALPSKTSMTGFEIYIMALPTDKDAMNLAKIENREYVEGKGVDVENVDRRTEMLLRILGDMQQNNKISESTDFAAALYRAGSSNGLPMRRVAQAPFFVLRGAGMPAVLLETGFVTNASEARLLTTSNYQQKIAQAMATGIINYLR